MSRPQAPKTWYLVPAKGDIPLGTISMSLVIYKNEMYLFGGENTDGLSNELYKFNFGMMLCL